MIRIFTGWDARESRGWHVFAQSVARRSSEPVALTPLVMDAQRDGTNAFTYSRFLVPYLCGFKGFAIFADAVDMLAVGDIAELWAMRSGWHAAQVVKHDYKTKHARKYVGTEMECANEDYPRKNWSSLIIWNCSHYMNRELTPWYIDEQPGSTLHRFQWRTSAGISLPDDRVGELPIEWNWLADEYGANTAAKLLHWTAGIPAIEAYKSSPHAQMWFYENAQAQRAPERAEKVVAA